MVLHCSHTLEKEAFQKLREKHVHRMQNATSPLSTSPRTHLPYRELYDSLGVQAAYFHVLGFEWRFCCLPVAFSGREWLRFPLLKLIAGPRRARARRARRRRRHRRRDGR